MTYFLKIFGCQMNYSDAERISTILEKNKFKPAASIDAADLIVFVSCGVRQMAEDRVYGQIYNIKKNYPQKKVILTGCLAHRKDVQRRLRDKVDLFTPINDFIKQIIKLKILNTKYQIPNTKNSLNINYLGINPKYTNAHSAYVPIMTGCNNFCSYCVVPYARGREYSRPAEEILHEVKNLTRRGCKEIILLGQNVNSYQSEKIDFPKLLRRIEKLPSKFWLTFLTSHPKDMSENLIEMIAKSKKISEYISLPAQAGDDDILRWMNRKYTTKHYINLIKIIRSEYKKYHPRIIPSISTDIIVGFPGETKRQFENTAKLFREVKFDMAYINKYSPRPETASWKMKDNVSKREKSRREKVLTDILKKTALLNNKKYIGQIVEVLVDQRFDDKEVPDGQLRREKVKRWRAKYLAHTRTQKKVLFFSNKKIPTGSFQKVKITNVKAFGLEGQTI